MIKYKNSTSVSVCNVLKNNLYKEDSKMSDISNNTNELTKEQVEAVWEHTHVRYLGNGTVELVNGVDRCVRKLHSFPEHLREQE